jgi:hypothetical protein
MNIEGICSTVAEQGYCYVPGFITMTLLAGWDTQVFADQNNFQESWSRLPWDQYVSDRYRRRRHSVLSIDGVDSNFSLRPNWPHYQSLEHNRVFGGLTRVFDPIEPEVLNGRVMQAILGLTRSITDVLLPSPRWNVELHQFRIEVADSRLGHPTPEGMHRDGVDYVFTLMVSRHNIVGGISTINGISGNHLEDRLLSGTFDMLVLDDHRIQHGVEPVSCLDQTKSGYRDIFVLTYNTEPTGLLH